MTAQGETKGSDPCVAVIAVHGVADQKPYESARAIGNMLLNIDSDRHARYEPFEQSELHIPTRPVVIKPLRQKHARAATSWWQRWLRWLRPSKQRAADQGFESFHELKESLHKRTARVRQRSARRRRGRGTAVGAGAPRAPVESAEPEVDTIFAHLVLDNYCGEGPGTMYQTIRLSGRRHGCTAKVDVYELYWADLSRLGTGVVRLFGELYQLLLHLPSLGVHTVDAAAIRNLHQTNLSPEQSEPIRATWDRYSDVQKMAAWTLRVPIPVLNLLLLGVVALTVAANVPNAWIGRAGWLASAILCGAIALPIALARRDWGTIRWMLVPLTILLGAMVLKRPLLTLCPADPSPSYWNPMAELYFRLAVLALAGGVVAIALLLILRSYARRCLEARSFSLASGAVLALAGFVLLALAVMGVATGQQEAPQRELLTGVGVRLAEVLWVVLFITWALLTALTWLAGAAGHAAKRMMRRWHPAYRRARRVAWTARLTIALPALLLMLLTLTMWKALEFSGGFLVGGTAVSPSSWVRALIDMDSAKKIESVRDYFSLMIDASPTSMLEAVLTLLGTALLLCLWALLPVVWAEVKPPTTTGSANAEHSQRLGAWVNKSFWLIRLACEGLYCSFVILLPIGLVIDVWRPEWTAWLELQTPGALLRTFAVVFILLLTIRGRFDVLNLGFRPIVDVALDVDNHLREHPQDKNPRARISARYVSLLRHLSAWRDERGRGYDAIIIIAHSQGTVITADLLRLLRQGNARDPQLVRLRDSLPIYFFTMGCPLRQLYSIRFPHLYQWARHLEETPGAGVEWTQHDIPDDRAPDPQSLGVRVWVNAFRSGDYVGRWLWRSNCCDYLFLPPQHDDPHRPWESAVDSPRYVSQDTSGTRREFCIGPGAHTHYWDATAPEIALELDRLIALAASEAVKV